MTHSVKARLTAIGVALLLVAGFALAQGYGTKPTTAEKPATKAAVVSAIVTGTNSCLGCALKSEKGAAAQCSIYGHRHVLKVSKVVGEDGKTISGTKNWVLHYLETDKSKDLVGGHHGEKLQVTGKVYRDERVIEVASFKPAPAETAKPKPVSEGT
jgi:hypothetical protein